MCNVWSCLLLVTLFAVSLPLPGWVGWGKPGGLAQGLQMHQYIYPVKLWNVWYWYCLPTMCHCICRCKLTCQTRCAMGPTFGFRDVYTLLPTLCHCILLFESLKIYYNIEKVFWYILVDFSRDAWLHAFELCSWGCLTLDGHAWLNTLTLCCQRFFQNDFPSATHVLHRLSSSSFAHCQTMGAATRSTAQTRLCEWEGQKISLSEAWLHCLANMVSKCQQGDVLSCGLCECK